jgi:hypothetical protein
MLHLQVKAATEFSHMLQAESKDRRYLAHAAYYELNQAKTILQSKMYAFRRLALRGWWLATGSIHIHP